MMTVIVFHSNRFMQLAEKNLPGDSIEIKFYRAQRVAILYCRIHGCSLSLPKNQQQYAIHHLSEKEDVYHEWCDAVEDANTKAV